MFTVLLGWLSILNKPHAFLKRIVGDRISVLQIRDVTRAGRVGQAGRAGRAGEGRLGAWRVSASVERDILSVFWRQNAWSSSVWDALRALNESFGLWCGVGSGGSKR